MCVAEVTCLQAASPLATTQSSRGCKTMGHVISYTSHGTKEHVTCHTSHATRHTSHVTRHTPHVKRHTPHVTRHTPHVTRHTSHLLLTQIQTVHFFIRRKTCKCGRKHPVFRMQFLGRGVSLIRNARLQFRALLQKLRFGFVFDCGSTRRACSAAASRSNPI